MSVKFLKYKFYSPAVTVPKRSDPLLTHVIGSIWHVTFKDNTQKVFTITLTNRLTDATYDSRKEAPNQQKYFILIDDGIPHLDKIPVNNINTLTTKRTRQYDIPENKDLWVAFDMNQFLIDSQEKIITIVKKQMGFYLSTQRKEEDFKLNLSLFEEKIKALYLNETEAKELFNDIFKRYLLDYIQENHPTRSLEAEERTPLVNNNNSFSLSSVFKRALCCCDL